MEIIKINPFEQPQMVEAIASVYQQSFGGEPWNEGYLCPVCEKVFARTLSIKKHALLVQNNRKLYLWSNTGQ